jgi:hypothetical protein
MSPFLRIPAGPRRRSAMLFVVLGNVRAGTTQERVGRRLKWSYPHGARLIAEYWLQTPAPNLITIVEADDIAPIMAGTSAWDDVYSFTVVPAVTAEQGLEIAKRMTA